MVLASVATFRIILALIMGHSVVEGAMVRRVMPRPRIVSTVIVSVVIELCMIITVSVEVMGLRMMERLVVLIVVWVVAASVVFLLARRERTPLVVKAVTVESVVVPLTPFIVVRGLVVVVGIILVIHVEVSINVVLLWLVVVFFIRVV